jgi:hypothetical protein
MFSPILGDSRSGEFGNKELIKGASDPCIYITHSQLNQKVAEQPLLDMSTNVANINMSICLFRKL